MKMKRHVRRFDYGQISSAERTPQGFLKCPGFATRTGVFPYMDANGKVRRELRHPDDVFDPKSLETLRNAPVTIEHPPEMITPANVSKYRKGHTTDRVEVNRELVETDVIFEDQDAIDAVEKEGIRELSCGYDADIVEESGTYNGAPYDYRQKNIVYNHLAAVKRGRAGPEVRLRMDSADAVMQAGDEPKSSVFSTESGVLDSEEVNTKKVVFMGEEVDLPSHIAEGFQDMLDRYDEMRAKQSIMEEETMKSKRADVDVNQKGISPQVKVEQQTPDGRSAPGKTAAKPGTITGPVGKADDDEDEKKKDGDEHGVIGGPAKLGKADEESEDADEMEDSDEDEKKDDEPASEKGGGASESDVDRVKKDMDEKQAKHDAEMSELQKKADAYAAASMDKPEQKPDGGKMDSADVERKIRARVKLERQAEKLVPFETAQKFDSMSDKEVLAAVIKYRSPKADLEGKSRVYLQQRFDSIVEAIAEEGTQERHNAGKALMGISGGRMDSDRTDADPSSARLKMVSDTRELWKQPLSASKK